MKNNEAMSRVGSREIKKDRGKLAPGDRKSHSIISIGTPPVTSPKVASDDDQGLTSLTKPEDCLMKRFLEGLFWTIPPNFKQLFIIYKVN
jgi:hypothetical protein